MAERVTILSPVGRIVGGDLYKGQTTDFDGNPLVYKTGPDKDKPRVNYFFALAIPKTQSHWANESWGGAIWQKGHADFPQAAQRADFAWKIVDGDSTAPNKKNKRPCDNEGYPGNWVLMLSNGFATRVYDVNYLWPNPILQENYVKPGYFVEVQFDVDGNGNQNNPGIYLNHRMVCFRAYGPEINFGADPTAAGFGAGALPPGASMTPPATQAAPLPPATAQNQAPAAPGANYAPIPVTPNPTFLQVPPSAPGAYQPRTAVPLPSNGAPIPNAGVTQTAPAPASPSNTPPPPPPPA
jgi:hypothetical protein